MLRLVDDLRVVVDAGRAGTTRHVLEAVRDDVGLGAAMSLLDRTGGGQGSSHLDDLDGLLGVADLHPDPAGFEPWLRSAFQRETDPGRRHAVDDPPGQGPGVGPRRRVRRRRRHRAPPPGRGRRGGAPGAPRRRSPAAATASPCSPTARRRSAVPRRAGRHRPDATPRPATRRPLPVGGDAPAPAAHRAPPPADGIEAAAGLVVTVPGGYEGTVEDADGRSALVRTSSRRHAARPLRRAGRARRAPGAARRADASCGARPPRPRRRCGPGASSGLGADGVPAYIVVNDKHLRGIALARPATPAELVACDGIGPAKLERYGDEILAVLEALP